MIVALARPLDVVTAGKDEKEARKKLDEVVQIFLESTSELGDTILEESGYEMVDGIWEPPMVRTSRETFELLA